MEYAELIDIMQVAEAQDDVLRKNYISQPPSSNVGHEANNSSYKVMKPLTNERSKKGKVVCRTLLMLSSLRRRAKEQHEAHLAIAGIEDPHP